MATDFKNTEKIIIIGAGPAGVAAAIQLSREGIKSVLIEKEKGMRNKPCGGAVSPRAITMYKLLGMPGNYFEKNGRRENQARIEGFGKVLNGFSHNKTYGFMMDRRILDWDFQQLAKQSKDVEILYGLKVVDVTLEGKRVRVKIKTKAKITNVFCKYLIAADGAGSIVRIKIFGAKIRDHDMVLTSGTFIDNNRIQRSYIRFHEDYLPTYSWKFPHKGDRTNMGIGIYKNVYKKKLGDVSLFSSLLSRMDPSFSKKKLERWFINTNPFQKKQYRRRIFLIGDAGGYVDAFTGEGILYALRSGISIAKTIAAMEKYGSQQYVVHPIYMFPTFVRLVKSKVLQLLFYHFGFTARVTFYLCARFRRINNLFSKYFSNT